MARYLVYLAHPYGKSEWNRNDSIKIECGIKEMMNDDDVEILNPLNDEKIAKVANDYKDDEEMVVAYCGGVVSACHMVVFCPGWKKSKGCQHEHKIAKRYGVPRIYLSRHEADIFREAYLMQEIAKQQKTMAKEEADVA